MTLFNPVDTYQHVEETYCFYFMAEGKSKKAPNMLWVLLIANTFLGKFRLR
jgi:hypothetical protein